MHFTAEAERRKVRRLLCAPSRLGASAVKFNQYSGSGKSSKQNTFHREDEGTAGRSEAVKKAARTRSNGVKRLEVVEHILSRFFDNLEKAFTSTSSLVKRSYNRAKSE